MKRKHTKTKCKEEDFLILCRGEMVGDECLFGEKTIIEYTAVTDT